MAENVVFQEGTYSSKVTGQINNPYSSDVSDLKVFALAFDASGNIIGSGDTYLDFIPGEGKSAIEVSVKVSGTPDSVELFPTLSSLSDFEE